jgi:salicylate hydroxylase
VQPPSRILVVGAGIGGLTAALAFAKAGFGVDVIERASELQEAGAGLQLSPNALSVLRQLALDPADLRGVAADRVTLRAAASGRKIARVPVLASDGAAYLSLHRTDLQAALLAAVRRQPGITLTLGTECRSFRSRGASLVLTLLDRRGETSERHADIVVAADGVNSAIARQLRRPPAQPSGDVAWRMTVANERNASATAAGGIEAWLGPARHAVAYPVREGHETNLVLIGPAADVAGDLAGSAAKQQLLQRFAGWDRRLLGLIDAAGPATAWPLSTRRPVKGPGDPPGLFLIGDAAHAMLPYAAQGAAMAIEDAWVAAETVAGAATLAEAQQAFAAQRDPRIAKVLQRVAFHRRVYHFPFPLSLARDVALRLRSEASLSRDLAWLYDWRPRPF